MIDIVPVDAMRPVIDFIEDMIEREPEKAASMISVHVKPSIHGQTPSEVAKEELESSSDEEVGEQKGMVVLCCVLFHIKIGSLLYEPVLTIILCVGSWLFNKEVIRFKGIN